MMGQVLVILLLFLFANAHVDGEDNNFRHENFGTYFIPHTRGHWDSSCTKEELTVMLKLVSSKFHKVYTPSVGTFRKFGSWRYPLNHCLAQTGVAAAEINSHAKSLLLQVNVGVDIGNNYLEKEMRNALDMANASNNLYPGTVSGITIWATAARTTRQTALRMVGKLQDFGWNVKESGLEFGFADIDCLTFEKSSRELLKIMDFVMCYYTADESVPPSMEAGRAFSFFAESAEIVSRFSNATRVMGYTVRLSKIKDDPNPTAVYWGELSRLARSSNFTVVVGYPIANPWLSERVARSAWWTQVKEEIIDESAFAEKRWLTPSQNKIIKKGLTDFWKSLTNLRFSTKSDVWSYGVTLWEIFSLASPVPYAGLTWTNEFIEILQSGLRPSKPEFCPEDMFTIMRSCWEMDPDFRPTFTEITSSVGAVLEKVAVESSTPGNGRGYVPL